MQLIPSIVKWFNTKRINQIEQFKKYPAETQKDILFNILNTAAFTRNNFV